MSRKTFIRFEPLPVEAGRKTGRWQVLSISSGGLLGIVTWYPSWRQYVLEPSCSTVWSNGCLRDVTAFLDAQNQVHRTKEEAT